MYGPSPCNKKQAEYHDDQPEGYQFLTNTEEPERYRGKSGLIVTEGAFYTDGTPWPSGWAVWKKITEDVES